VDDGEDQEQSQHHQAAVVEVAGAAQGSGLLQIQRILAKRMNPLFGRPRVLIPR